ncbi:MAG: DUF4111 domain-containing protein [Cyanobacteria bacterium]|nr:DUF4111 domain-containing protein [Cyanobacteriota bacterium]
MTTGLLHPHEEGRSQGWSSADADLREFITNVVASVEERLQPIGFVGAYLHGSLAMDSFYRPKSDLDLLFVVNKTLSPRELQATAKTLLSFSDCRPITGDLEVSVLRLEDTRNFQHPLPFEFHYSETMKESILAGSCQFSPGSRDGDLAAHLTVLQQRGFCLAGRPIEDTFGKVPLEAFQNSIIEDLDWILTENNIIESPFYGVLNCCRVLAMNETGWDVVWSKDEGGEWGLQNFPDAHRSIVGQALSCYRSPLPVPPETRRTDGHDWDHNALLNFRDFVRSMR